MSITNSQQTKNEKQLDEIVNNSNTTPSISQEKTPIKTESIDSKLNLNSNNENKTIFEKAFSKTYKAISSAVLLTGTLGYTLGTYGFGPAITSAGFMVGESIIKKKNGEKFKRKDAKDQFYLGQIMGGLLNYLFQGVGYFATIPAKAAYVALASIPAFNAANLYVSPYIKNYTPSKLFKETKEKGLGVLKLGYDSLRKNFKTSMKNVYTKPVPGLYASGAIYNNIFTTEMTTKYALAATLSTIYRIASSSLSSVKKMKQTIDNTSKDKLSNTYSNTSNNYNSNYAPAMA